MQTNLGMMWTSTPADNINYVLDTPIALKYNKLFNDGQFRTTSYIPLEYIENTIAPYYTPIYALPYPNKRYLTFQLIPILINKIKVGIIYTSTISVITEVQDNVDYAIIFIQDNQTLTDEYIPHQNFSTLLEKETYLYNDKFIVVKCSNATNATYITNNIHKYISILAGIVNAYEHELIYPFDYKMYEALFNYNVYDYFNTYDVFINTFYDMLIIDYDSQILTRIAKHLVDNNTSVNESKINEIQNEINHKEQALADLYKQLRFEQIMYNANMYTNKEEKIKEFSQMFEACQNLKDVALDEYKNIRLHFVCPLINYDKELAKEWCMNTDNPFSDHNVQDIMYKLLCSDKYTILFDAVVVWDMNIYSIYSYGDYKFINNYLAQPHIMYYNCFGDNKHIINEQLVMRNFDIALDATDAALSSLNILDGAVLNKFIHDINVKQDALIRNNETGKLVKLREVFADDSIVKPGA